VGGIIPPADAAELLALGVAQVFTPGASLQEIAQFVRKAVRS
jgi:methylmalonyl-CoA mutase C-terminal domain/subunit